jgi:hypothetical protein
MVTTPMTADKHRQPQMRSLRAPRSVPTVATALSVHIAAAIRATAVGMATGHMNGMATGHINGVATGHMKRWFIEYQIGPHGHVVDELDRFD